MKLLGACDGFHYLNNCISPQSDEILVTSTSVLDVVLMGPQNLCEVNNPCHFFRITFMYMFYKKCQAEIQSGCQSKSLNNDQ